MNQQTVVALTQRLDALERDNRRLRQLMAVLVVFATALVIITQLVHVADAQSSRLVVQSLTIRDATGVDRIVLNADQRTTDGRFIPSLEIKDERGAPHLSLGLDSTSAAIAGFFGRLGPENSYTPSVVVSFNQLTNEGSVTVYDSNGDGLGRIP